MRPLTRAASRPTRLRRAGPATPPVRTRAKPDQQRAFLAAADWNPAAAADHLERAQDPDHNRHAETVVLARPPHEPEAATALLQDCYSSPRRCVRTPIRRHNRPIDGFDVDSELLR